MLRRGRGIGVSRLTRLKGMAERVRGRAPSRAMIASSPVAASSAGRSNGATVAVSVSSRPTRRSPAIEKVAIFKASP